MCISGGPIGKWEKRRSKSSDHISRNHNTLQGQLYLPEDKLQQMMRMVTEWLPCKVCTCRELESVISTLQHACKIIRPGRSFLQWTISLLSIAKWPYHHIRLNHEFKSDLMWWKVFGSHWNEASLLIIPQATPQVMLTSDASGLWGCGAWSRSDWFQLQWDKLSACKQITIKSCYR